MDQVAMGLTESKWGSLYDRNAGLACSLLGGLILVAGLWMAILAAVSYDRAETTRRAETEAANLVHVVEEHFLRTVENLDHSLLQLRDQREADGGLRGAVAELLKLGNNEQMFHVSEIDRQGQIRYTSLGPLTRPIDLSDREHFQVHQDATDDRLFVSRPSVGRSTGKWSIHITRRLVDRQGAFDGVLELSVTPNYFFDFLSGLDIGRGGAVSVIGMDRYLRLRMGRNQDDRAAYDMQLPADRVFFDPKAPSSGVLHFKGYLEGVRWLGAYRRLPDYPLVVLVLLDEAEVMAPFHNRQHELFSGGLAGSLAIMAASLMIGMLLRRQANTSRLLTHSEARFRLLSESVADYAIFMLDPQGRVVTWNRSAERMKGYPAEEIIGQSIDRFYSPADVAAGKPAQLLRSAQTVGRVEDEGWCQHKDGSRYFADTAISRIIDDHGVLLGFANVTRDATARKASETARQRVEAELRAANIRLKLVIDTAAEGIIGFDDESRIMFANRAAAEMLCWGNPEAMQGRPSEEVLGLRSANGGKDDALKRSAILDTLEDGQTRRVPGGFFQGAHGRLLPVEYTVSALLVEGFPVGAVMVFHDVTQRRDAEREISHLLSYQRAILDNTPMGIGILSIEREILQANNTFCAIFGRPRDDMIGRPSSILYADDEDFEALGQQAYPLVRSGGTFCGDVLMRRGDGTRIWARLVAHMVDAEAPDLGVVWAVMDITERKALDTDLRRSNAELERFAYVASHDLRQPLRMISSYLTLIERRLKGQMDEDISEFIFFAVDGAKRMDKMIVDLLDYSRIGRIGGAMTEGVSLRMVVDRAVANLAVAIEDSGASVVIGSPLPEVQGSESELERLFQNLIGNAVKFRAEDRPPVVTVACQEERNEWLVSVTDNGIGIEAKDIDRLFTIFQRLVTREQYEGTGIGLASCRKIIEHHGGRIWVESEPGSGSRFVVALPKIIRES